MIMTTTMLLMMVIMMVMVTMVVGKSVMEDLFCFVFFCPDPSRKGNAIGLSSDC